MTDYPPADKSGSFAKSLFLGNILEENLFPFPAISKDERETLEMVIDSLDKFAEGKSELFASFDREGTITDEHLEEMKAMGLFGLIIPEEYGGIGLSASGYARVVEQATFHDSATSLTLGAHSSIGMKGLLLFGTDEQKSKYLPDLATGERIAAFCLTEPGSGSDAASISTSAEEQEDGSFVLNGEKIWITNGPIARFYTVFARTSEDKLTAFIVDREFEGVSTGPKEDKMGIRGSVTTTVILESVSVPAENVLGNVGEGFKVAMTILNNGRTGLGGGCIGGMKRALQLSSAQAQERKQFDNPIASYGLIQEKIATMATDCFVAQSVVAMIGHYIDADFEDYSVEAACSKVFCSERMWHNANEALQIAGGNGYMKEYPYEQIVRDCRINLIFEGTNEILRLFIALSGLKEAGRYLKDISDAASSVFNNPLHGFCMMSEYASKKFSQLTSVGGERIAVDSSLEEIAKVYEQATLALSKESEQVLKKYKKKIIHEQFILKRLANVAIDIFVGSCTLARVDKLIKEQGLEKCKTEIAMLERFTREAKHRIAEELREVERKEDTLAREIAERIYEDGGFNWETM